MQDSARGCAAARERASVEGSNVCAKRQSRRRWSAEEKARVVRESLRPGERVGEVARRYRDDSEQLCSDPAESVHEGCSPNNCAFTKPPTSGSPAADRRLHRNRELSRSGFSGVGNV